ncbi:prepilin-type N-terminal cleavage/methylation domain-containing protein [Bacillus sp. DTU_2020_1000418_1_SI_GHA_SEK_038]|uniref:type II secretion system protein n=1 Tax=Bacillus sp. DTU_2020_1000418_1_SI_GHA_SEK_038 TaxID=3077585 RepID=UPI0028EF3D4A|nr:prepilin-type N-terminal cleavage/methylation domain-containing protein [Bacillus sp. DTU_2020_1000418_1_SI_GHA_SEK_038]WNS74472.1 prepilin-type N-terminal cleavage/methylation domain-containing protein [Bacillus sp. DTU_2020_1000418_1_SI_GHA_SEK_038]
MLKQNQNGLTLIELLAIISILSIVGVIIWSVFFQGVKYSNNAVTRNQMQQEANIITTKLKEIHLTSEKYSIVSNNGIIAVTYDDKNGTSQEVIFENSNLEFSSTSINNRIPKETDTRFTLIVTDKDSGNSHSITTLLYRLKGGNNK